MPICKRSRTERRSQRIKVGAADQRSAHGRVGLGSLLVLTHEMGIDRYAERHRVESESRHRLGMLALICSRLKCHIS
jgi:hypothetical protein